MLFTSSGMSNSTCGACKKALGDPKESIKCTGNCGLTFHVCCTPIKTLENLTKLGAEVESWVCPKCEHGESSLSSKNLFDQVFSREDLDEIIGDIETSVMAKIKSTVKEVSELKTSVAALTRSVEEVKNTTARVEEEVHRVQLENSRLATRHGQFWRTLLHLQDDLSDLQQQRYSGNPSGARNTKIDDIMNFGGRALVSFGVVHVCCALVFFFFFTRYLKKGMKSIKMDVNQGEQVDGV